MEVYQFDGRIMKKWVKCVKIVLVLWVLNIGYSKCQTSKLHNACILELNLKFQVIASNLIAY